MYQFVRRPEKWWQKPLIEYKGRPVPAELAVLFKEMQPSEKGVWMNSRGIRSGACDLVMSEDPAKSYETVRIPLPNYVGKVISDVLAEAGVSRGCPDLVIWDDQTSAVRFIEVKCPHWDIPTSEQEIFLDTANAMGFGGKIVEWEFAE